MNTTNVHLIFLIHDNIIWCWFVMDSWLPKKNNICEIGNTHNVHGRTPVPKNQGLWPMIHLPNAFLPTTTTNTTRTAATKKQPTNQNSTFRRFFPELQYHFPWSLSQALRSKHYGPTNRHVETIVGTTPPACRKRKLPSMGMLYLPTLIPYFTIKNIHSCRKKSSPMDAMG